MSVFDDLASMPADTDHDWPSVAGLSIFDQLMLAVIQANPDRQRKVTTGQRLEEARRALLGCSMTNGRVSIDDRLALNAMAEAEARWIAEGKAVSTAALAKYARHLTTGASPEATQSRLVRSYKASRTVLALEARYQDEIAVSLERQKLERLLREMRDAGVSVAEPGNQFKSPVGSLGWR